MNLTAGFCRYGRNLRHNFDSCIIRPGYYIFLLAAISMFVCSVGADGGERSREKASPMTDKSISDQNEIRTAGEDNKMSTEVPNEHSQIESTVVKMYRSLFKQKRASHLEAIQKILQLGSFEKQHKMISLILNKLFMVMTDAKIKLMEAGFTPGDPFPTEEKIQDALSIVLENTAFLGEIVLRLPDVAHSVLRNNSEWQQVIRWCISFSNDTRILSETEMKLISLMAQELGVIEKSPDFINLYRADAKLEKMVDVEAEKLLKEKIKANKKQERKEKKKHRGPKLSSPRHNEL